MIKLADIQSSEQLIEDLSRLFDFDVCRAADNSSWIKLSTTTPFIVVAGDGTGGVFLAYGCGDTAFQPILYATSEGQAGRVASNLTEFLAILLAVPYWFDLLKFSSNGDLMEMRKTALFMEREYAEDYPDLSEASRRIIKSLQLPHIDDPIKVIHDSVHATDCTLIADDGWHYDSLFNHFKSSDNPNWR